MDRHLLIFGFGYSGRAVALAARALGWHVSATRRAPGPAEAGVRLLAFAEAGATIEDATHVLSTVPPNEAGDPVLAAYGSALAAAPGLRWLCYLSTTGVYGDRGGAWVDEHSAPMPLSPRAHRRVAAEQAWAGLPGGRAVELFRLGGIYGPGRSVIDELRAGTARRIEAPGHLFGRIHRDDIAGAVLAAADRPARGTRVLNGVDDEPAASADVVAEGARLLGVGAPPSVLLEEAWSGMSAMARSFWVESRCVASRLTQEWIGRTWRYPSYREGLRQIIAEDEGVLF